MLLSVLIGGPVLRRDAGAGADASGNDDVSDVEFEEVEEDKK